jgi:hypothetical protein
VDCSGLMMIIIVSLSAIRPVPIGGVKVIAESLSQHDEKHVVPTPLSAIRVGRRVEEFDVNGIRNNEAHAKAAKPHTPDLAD